MHPSDAGPLVWAHVGTAHVLPAVQDVLSRAKQQDPSMRHLISATPDSGLHGPNIVSFAEERSGVASDFLSQHNPNLCIWADASITTPLFGQVHKANIPVMLLEPHTEAMQKRPWLWRKTVARQALRPVSYALAQSTEISAQLRALGVPSDNIDELGPMAAGVVPPGFDENERDHLGEILTSRPVWCAICVPLGEMQMLAQAYAKAQRSAHRMLLILDPANPDIADAAAKVFQNEGLVVHRRDVEGEPDTLTQVFLTDTGSELGLWYRLATMAYMGGSFSKGHPVPNPLLPAALGSAILHGPHTSTYRAGYQRLAANHATVQVNAPQELARAIVDLLAPDQSAALANAGWEVVSQGAEVADRLVSVILEKLGLDDGDGDD